jgi:hypothetical protein
MNEYLNADSLRIIIPILSLSFAVWQYFQKRRFKKLIALEAVELHKNIAHALGATDAAVIAISNGGNGTVEIGRAQGICQSILYESAKLYCNLKNTKLDDVDDLIENGQLGENYRNIYYSFSDNRRGSFGKLFKSISKIF